MKTPFFKVSVVTRPRIDSGTTVPEFDALAAVLARSALEADAGYRCTRNHVECPQNHVYT